MSSNILRLRRSVRDLGAEWSVPIIILWSEAPHPDAPIRLTEAAETTWLGFCAYVQRVAAPEAQPMLYLSVETLELRRNLAHLHLFVEAAQRAVVSTKVREMSLRLPRVEPWRPELGMVVHIRAGAETLITSIQRPCLCAGPLVQSGEGGSDASHAQVG